MMYRARHGRVLYRPIRTLRDERLQVMSGKLTLWRRNYFFFNFSTSYIQNVNNTGTKQVSFMKQTAF